MLDPEAVRIYNGACNLISSGASLHPKGLAEDQLMICTQWITRFGFKQKTWSQCPLLETLHRMRRPFKRWLMMSDADD